ncbi:SFT2-domain-containing protein [Boletus reticuloceps]|uniref:Protein transport protein SFT2 n=1 Tax=Boletus reticuloceps TaxID=495285 RepID=A0A8I3AD72_9AGAM|nr:SFT2-domain-containing protein [Boletus reticuloceps]
MASKGWLNLESAGGLVSDAHFFEGDSAFNFLGLTRTQRLYGFVGWYLPRLSCHVPLMPPPSLIFGFVLSLLGSILLFVGQLGSFAVLYTIGIIISLVGTGFLIGFGSQIKLMFKPVRVLATIIFLASIGLVYVGAFVIKSEVRPPIFVIIEYLAYTWYCLSYIPYARSAVLRVVGMS